MGKEKLPGILKGIEEAYGKKTWGGVGYCWGGKVISITSGTDTLFKAVALTSPASKLLLALSCLCHDILLGWSMVDEVMT